MGLPQKNNPRICFIRFAFIYIVIRSVSETHDLFLFPGNNDLVMSNHIKLTRVQAQSSPVENNTIFIRNSFIETHDSKHNEHNVCRIPFSFCISKINN